MEGQVRQLAGFGGSDDSDGRPLPGEWCGCRLGWLSICGLK